MKTKKVIGTITSVGEYAAAAIMAFLAVLIGINVISRRFFNAPIYGSTELVQYGTLAAISLAAANTTLRREHPCVGLVVDALPPVGKSILRMITDCVCTVLLGLVTINLWPYFMEQYQSPRTTETLFIPYWIISGMILFCIFTVALVMLYHTIVDITNIVKPETYEEHAAEISLEGSGAIEEAQKAMEELEKKENVEKKEDE